MSTSPKGVLLISHDFSYPFAKTTEFIASALRRMGIRTIVRDCCDLRLSALILDEPQFDSLCKQAEDSIRQRWEGLIRDFDIDCVMSLDLGWFVVPEHLTEHPAIKKIYSIWFDDLRSWSIAETNKVFPQRNKTFLDNITHPKVTHSFYGKGIAMESYLMGLTNQITSKLAAPYEFLHRNEPCEYMDKLVFIGNPGLRGAPHEHALKLMNEDCELPELRELARLQALGTIKDKVWKWTDLHPDIVRILELATAAKIESPFESTLKIIQICGENYPSAIEVLNNSGYIVDAAWLVKFVLRYDRPALVHRLYKNQLLDVISNEEEWEPYNIKASPSIFAQEMPLYYRRYLAHANAPNPLRDATANEKLFEISACGRTSINLDSPDVRECYSDQEVCFVQTLKEAEEVARDLIAHPDKALTKGKYARMRTAKEHTWDKRIEQILKTFPN